MAAALVHTERAHAKINLMLRILAREASGYHGIETLFQLLALHDVVRVSVNDGPSTLHCEGPAMPPNSLGDAQSNLAWRAASAYAEASTQAYASMRAGGAGPSTSAAHWLDSWQISIEKHIPVGGGLGGGSADAAAVLRALDRLAPSPLGPTRLLEIAGTLGADVPFLTSMDGLALGWGRGDRLLALTPLPPMGVTLLTFMAGVNTGAAYAAVAESRAGSEGMAALIPHRYPAAAFRTWEAVAALTHNDFEAVVPAMHEGVRTVLPLVQAAARRLRTEALPGIGQMSGSGATCFVLHPVDWEFVAPLPSGVRVIHTRTG